MKQDGPLIPGGYILLSRKIIESEIWQKPPLYLKVWIYLLAAAQHRDYKKLKRGQLRTSIPELIEACSWKVGFRTERPSKDQIYQILTWFREVSEESNEADTRATMKATMVTTMRATHGMLVNIDNYWLYQDPKNYESNDESNAESNNEADTKPDNTNKNDKNGKKKKESNKTKYGEEGLVSLTDAEYQKLLNAHGQDGVDRMIEILDNYKGANNKKYASDYKAILNWVVNRYQEEVKKNSLQQNKPLTKQEQNKAVLQRHMQDDRRVITVDGEPSDPATNSLFNSLPYNDNY